MKRTVFLVFLGCFFSVIVLKAQIQQDHRIELELYEERENYEVIPIGKEGILLFSKLDDRKNNNQTWLFEKYSTSFKKEWEKEKIIDEKFSFQEQFIDDNGDVYLLFKERKSADMQILVFYPATGEFKLKGFTLPLKRFYFSEFKIIDGNAFIVGSLKKGTAVIHHDLSSGKTKILPISFEKRQRAVFQSLQINKKEDYVSIAYRIEVDKQKTISIHAYNGSGNLVKRYTVDPQSENELLSGRVSEIGNNETLIIGTYAISRGAQGMYVSKYLGDEQQFIKYYSFTDFDNFFNYLSDKQQERIERKKEKKEKKGKELMLSYNLLVHDVIVKDGYYLLICEAYYPTYRTVTEYYTTYINGSPVTQMRTRQVFDGWLYTHATVAGISNSGELLWDNTFDIWNIKTFTLKERVHTNIEGDDVVLVYGTGSSISSKTVKGSTIVDGEDYSLIDTQNEDDKVKWSVYSDMQYWFDKKFIVWGFQKIKNKEDKENKKRKVFYCNTIDIN